MGGDEEEECCDKDDDENEHKKINYHSKRRPSGMLNLTHKERESLRYVFPIICFGFFRRYNNTICSTLEYFLQLYILNF